MSAMIGVSEDTKPQVRFILPVSYKQEGAWTIATCDQLDVASQGKTHAEAHASIIEAVSLFLETCYEMGTLGEVLRELGFSQMQPPSGNKASPQETIEVPMELVAHAQTKTRKTHAAC